MNIKSIALIFMSIIVRASILAVAILAVFRTGEKAYDFGFRIFTEEAVSPEPGRDVAVTIAKGDSTADVGKMLEEKGLIRDYMLFVVQKKCSVYDDDIKPGFYTLNTSMTAEDMFAIIAGRKDEEGTEEDEEGLDMSVVADPSTEGDSAIDKAAGEWEGTENEDGEIHDPYEEGANVEEGEDTEAAAEEDDG
ncbi:MAG: endolytic transglycosylase MltG [Lachnospiraceae bacterium]|nr:endolytic transglycosylase MltG [Lachnospiraceae bacterium]